MIARGYRQVALLIFLGGCASGRTSPPSPNSGNFEERNGRAWQFWRSGEEDAALSVLDDLERDFPEEFRGDDLRGCILFCRREWDAARRDFRHPQCLAACLFEWLLRSRAGQPIQANEALGRPEKIHRELPSFYVPDDWQLADYLRGDCDESAIVASPPGRAIDQFFIAEKLLMLGDREQAVRHFELCLSCTDKTRGTSFEQIQVCAAAELNRVR